MLDGTNRAFGVNGVQGMLSLLEARLGPRKATIHRQSESMGQAPHGSGILCLSGDDNAVKRLEAVHSCWTMEF